MLRIFKVGGERWDKMKNMKNGKGICTKNSK